MVRLVRAALTTLAVVPSADQVPVKSTRASGPDGREMFPAFSGILPDDMISLKRGTTSGKLFACQMTGDMDPTMTVVASSSRSMSTWTRRGPNNEAEYGADEVV